MSGWTVAILVVQGGLAALALWLLWRWVFPLMRRSGTGETLPGARLPGAGAGGLVTNVWLPLIIVTPLLFAVGFVGDSVRGWGAIPMGVPVWVGMMGVGVMLFQTPGDGAASEPDRRWWCFVPGAGLLLLMLGAAHELNIWVGQCVFALAALVMWINTPSASALSGGGPSGGRGAEQRASLAMLVAMVCASGEGGLLLVVPEDDRRWSAIIPVAFALAAMVLAGVRLSAAPMQRVVGWTAALGVLLGIGLMSCLALVSAVRQVVENPRFGFTADVAHGFGMLAPEGAILLLLPGSVVVMGRGGPGARRVVGVAAILAALSGLTWRLLAL